MLAVVGGVQAQGRDIGDMGGDAVGTQKSSTFFGLGAGGVAGEDFHAAMIARNAQDIDDPNRQRAGLPWVSDSGDSSGIENQCGSLHLVNTVMETTFQAAVAGQHSESLMPRLNIRQAPVARTAKLCH